MSPVTPEISVIIPVHNGEKYLAQGIQSVLDQDHPALEILVIDNLSTDATARIAKGFSSVRYFYLGRKGLCEALNHGVKKSRGALLGFLDADDLWTQNKLAVQLAAFDHNPVLDMVFGHVQQFISPDLERSARESLSIPRKNLPGFSKGSMLIRKEGFGRVGSFDPNIKVADFVDWYMRAQEKNLQELMLPEIVLMRRIHESNMGLTERHQRIDYVRVIRRGLNRRRSMNKA